MRAVAQWAKKTRTMPLRAECQKEFDNMQGDLFRCSTGIGLTGSTELCMHYMLTRDENTQKLAIHARYS